MAAQRNMVDRHRTAGNRSDRLRIFWSGVWAGTLILIVALMITAAGCQPEQPPSPRVTGPKLNSAMFLDRHWVESDAVRIIQGVQEI